MLFRTLEDGIQPPVAECLTGFGRPLAAAVSGGLGNEMARSQENPNGSTRPTSGPLPRRSPTDSIQRQSALVNLRRRVRRRGRSREGANRPPPKGKAP